jgi:hypothetical protein
MTLDECSRSMWQDNADRVAVIDTFTNSVVARSMRVPRQACFPAEWRRGDVCGDLQPDGNTLCAVNSGATPSPSSAEGRNANTVSG